MGDDVQKDEQAVLESIYADDFSMSAARTGAVRLRAPLTEDSDTKSNDFVLVSFTWPDDYPNSPALFALPVTTDAGNINYRLSEDAKKKVVERLNEECIPFAGGAMIFSALDAVKSAYDSLVAAALLANAPKPVAKDASLWEHSASRSDVAPAGASVGSVPAAAAKGGEKKEQLSKAQKRRAQARLDSKGEKPRGWNWVDVIGHLSRTGVAP